VVVEADWLLNCRKPTGVRWIRPRFRDDHLPTLHERDDVAFVRIEFENSREQGWVNERGHYPSLPRNCRGVDLDRKSVLAVTGKHSYRKGHTRREFNSGH
jgi:hypothetical protein